MLADEAVAVRLMATIWADSDGVHDDLAEPPDLDEWLDAIGVDRHGGATTRDEFLRARDLRDAVRRLAAFVTGDERPAAVSARPDVAQAIRTVNAAVRELPVPQLVRHGESLDLADGPTASAVITALAGVAAGAQQLL